MAQTVSLPDLIWDQLRQTFPTLPSSARNITQASFYPQFEEICVMYATALQRAARSTHGAYARAADTLSLEVKRRLHLLLEANHIEIGPGSIDQFMEALQKSSQSQIEAKPAPDLRRAIVGLLQTTFPALDPLADEYKQVVSKCLGFASILYYLNDHPNDKPMKEALGQISSEIELGLKAAVRARGLPYDERTGYNIHLFCSETIPATQTLPVIVRDVLGLPSFTERNHGI